MKFICQILLPILLIGTGDAMEESLRGAFHAQENIRDLDEESCFDEYKFKAGFVCKKKLGPISIRCECEDLQESGNPHGYPKVTNPGKGTTCYVYGNGETLESEGLGGTEVETGDGVFSLNGWWFYGLTSGETGIGNIPNGPSLVIHTGQIEYHENEEGLWVTDKESGKTVDVCAALA